MVHATSCEFRGIGNERLLVVGRGCASVLAGDNKKFGREGYSFNQRSTLCDLQILLVNGLCSPPFPHLNPNSNSNPLPLFLPSLLCYNKQSPVPVPKYTPGDIQNIVSGALHNPPSKISHRPI